MSLDRKRRGGVSFVVVPKPKPEPRARLQPMWASRAFCVGLLVGAYLGVVVFLAVLELGLRFGADVPLTLAIVRATP